MKFFYLSSKANKLGKFEVHEKECDLIPEALDRDYLGPFNNGMEALRKAKELHPDSVLCSHCCSSSTPTIFFNTRKS